MQERDARMFGVQLMLDYLSLFVWSFLAATLVPIGSEVALVAVIYRHHVVWLPVVVATVGNYGGACTTYWLGWRAGQTWSGHVHLSPQHIRARTMVQRYGAIVLLLSWVPLLGDVLVAVAGAARVPFARFSWWVFVGKAARYSIVGTTAYALLR